MTTPQEVQKEIKYLKTRIIAVDDELSKLIALHRIELPYQPFRDAVNEELSNILDVRKSLCTRLLSEVERYQDAQQAEAEVSEVSE